jgi:AraC-like DNA-binding protein
MNAPAHEASVPIAVQCLRQACLALDSDIRIARRDILRALELLLDSVLQTPLDGPVHGLAPWQAGRVADHVLANLEMPIRVRDLARVTRLSTSHFSRAFKLSFNVSPHAYIMTLRLAHARSLMLESDEQMSAIAAACGFADQAHFSRVFRRKVGCAPGLWRRERRGCAPGGLAAPVENLAATQDMQRHRSVFPRAAAGHEAAA